MIQRYKNTKISLQWWQKRLKAKIKAYKILKFRKKIKYYIKMMSKML